MDCGPLVDGRFVVDCDAVVDKETLLAAVSALAAEPIVDCGPVTVGDIEPLVGCVTVDCI